MSLILVMTGGAIGAGARYLVGRALASHAPVATLAVNIVGCLLMGLLAAQLARGTGSEAWRLFLGVGVLGGFTTFSAFSLDTVQMIERGSIVPALGYIVVSVIGSFAALAGGLWLGRAV